MFHRNKHLVFYYWLLLVLVFSSCTKTNSVLVPYSSQNKPQKKDDASNNLFSKLSSANQAVVGQLPGGDFNDWYEEDCYSQPGLGAGKTIWSSGNAGFKKGVVTACGNDMPTASGDGYGGTKAAVLTTKEVPLGTLVGKGIAAGNVFTGSFHVDPALVLGAIPTPNQVRPILGTSYTGFPIAFSFRYKYEPGNLLKDGRGNAKSGSDAMDAYVILEHRDDNGKAYRLAVGWFRSGLLKKEWTKQRVEMKYSLFGVAPEGLQPYELHALKYGSGGDPSVEAAKQALVEWGDTTTMKTNFIVVTFSSSYQGDDFIGAPGSKLIIDDFKLIYADDEEKEKEAIPTN